MLNNADRALCRSLKTKCRVRGKAPTAKVQKPVAEKAKDAPPVPVQKPVVSDVANPAPIPREKPQSPKKIVATLPEDSPEDAQLGKVDRLTTAQPLPTQRPVIDSTQPKVIVTKASAPPPVPRTKPQELRQRAVVVPPASPKENPFTNPKALQQQAVLIPRVVPKETLPGDDNDACLRKLRAVGAKFTVPATNVDSGSCHVENPVHLNSVNALGSTVQLPEGPLFNCKFALQFSKWLKESGAPILTAQLGSPIKKISTGPGYECRGRNGDSSAKISEHGFGNAVDITTLGMQDGRTLSVEEAINPDATNSGVWHGLRASACGYFTTVLGPGSNAAHAKHFHFDMGVHGKSGNYRICE
jgi:hypothetical protein